MTRRKRDDIATRVYQAGQKSGVDWLATVDNSPNAMSYTIADELLEWRDVPEMEKQLLDQATEITRLKDALLSIKYAARAATGGDRE